MNSKTPQYHEYKGKPPQFYMCKVILHTHFSWKVWPGDSLLPKGNFLFQNSQALVLHS